jgi:uncharacterized protein YbjT (DUF2867 family)
MKVSDKPILILGGTGHYGRHIVRSLSGRGEPVRVLSRNADAAQRTLGNLAEIVEGDITSRQSVVGAMAGARAVLISVSAFSLKLIRKLRLIERDSVLAVLELAQQMGIPRVVYISVYDIREDIVEEFGFEAATYKGEVETALARSGLNATVLGAAPSMAIYFTMIRGNRMIVPGGGSAALPTVSATDVGEIAAQAVLRDDLGGQRIRMVGPEAISFPEAAKRISAVTGTDLQFKSIPLLPLQIAAIVTAPVNPYLRSLLPSIKLMNRFPQDVALTVGQDHQRLLDTFEYTPTTLEMEARRWMQGR